MAKNGVKKYRFMMPTYLAAVGSVAGVLFIWGSIEAVLAPPRELRTTLYTLSPEAAYLCAWGGLLAFSWFLFVVVLHWIATRNTQRFIVLGNDAVTLPSAVTYLKDTVVPYASITQIRRRRALNLLSSKRQGGLVIEHSHGRVSFSSVYLPSYEEFEDLHSRLKRRLEEVSSVAKRRAR